MTNSSHRRLQQKTQNLYYPLTPKIAKELRSLPLFAADWRLWSYLVTLDPFGEEYQELPDLATILTECNISKASFYRALAKFDEHQLFDTQPIRIAFLNLRGSKSRTHETENLTHETENLTHETENLTHETFDSLERNCEVDGVSNTDDCAECTNTKQKTLKKNRTEESVFPAVNREELGACSDESENSPKQEMQRLSDLIEAGGIKTNKTIKTALAELISRVGSAAATKTVENSLSAVLEQVSRGTVRNKGGLLVASLKRGYTANEAKRKARTSREPPKAPDMMTVEIAIDQALLRGDRSYVLARLQQLWAEGWHIQLEETLSMRRDWQLNITTEGINDISVSSPHAHTED